jgi:hypothetical protein
MLCISITTAYSIRELALIVITAIQKLNVCSEYPNTRCIYNRSFKLNVNKLQTANFMKIEITKPQFYKPT